MNNTPSVIHVASKLPSGLMIGGVRVLGAAVDYNIQSEARPPLYSGFRITTNIPAKAWEDWYKNNKDAPMITNHIIFAETDLATLRQKVKSFSSVRTGFEPR